MNDVVTSPLELEQCFAKNPHFTEVKWLCDFRAQQLKLFLERGLPTRKEEAWKYTEINKNTLPSQVGIATEWLQYAEKIAEIKKITDIIFTFVNGHFIASLSYTETLPKEVTLSTLNAALHSHENQLKKYLNTVDGKRYPFAQLNAALMMNGLFLEIPKNVKMTVPIYLLFVNTAQNDYMSSPRNLILAHAESAVTVIEDHQGERTAERYFTNVVTEIHAHRGAKMNYYKLQDEANTATHIANVFVRQEQDSQVKTYFFSRGAQLAREDLSVWQEAKGTESYLYGLYELTRDKQHIDHHVHVDHLAPHGTSSMLYKGLLDKKSRAVFNGKVYVHPDAQQINAHQSNHNILLSNDAEVSTKPELEIYADDVKCTHGATIGQLDHEALFYLCSRGISASEAHTLLTRAFLEEVYSKIDAANIRDFMQKRMNSHDE